MHRPVLYIIRTHTHTPALNASLFARITYNVWYWSIFARVMNIIGVYIAGNFSEEKVCKQILYLSNNYVRNLEIGI